MPFERKLARRSYINDLEISYLLGSLKIGMTLENPSFSWKRKWKCLDEEGEIVGQVSGATAEEAIGAYISAAAEDPFRSNVHVLVSGATRLNVQNLVVDQGGKEN